MSRVERGPEEYDDFGDLNDYDSVVAVPPRINSGLSLDPTGELVLDRVPLNTAEDYGDVDLTDSVSVYFHWVSRLPKKLSYEQQQAAFRLLREDPEALASQLNTDGFKDLSDIDGNRELLENAFAESVTVRDFIQKCSLRLVIKIANKYRWSGIDFMDLIQEGNSVLGKAVDRFDHERPADAEDPDGERMKFSTFATQWIRQAVGRSVENDSNLIRVPVHMYVDLRKLQKARGQFMRDHGSDPTADELRTVLRQHFGLEDKRIDSVLKAYQSGSSSIPRSLDQVINGSKGDSKTALGDLIADDRFDTQEEGIREASITEMRRLIEQSLGEFSERDQEILRMRYGFDRSGNQSLAAVAKQFGISRGRVGQIEKAMLDQLRNNPALRYYMTGERTDGDVPSSVQVNGSSKWNRNEQVRVTAAPVQDQIKSHSFIKDSGDVRADVITEPLHKQGQLVSFQETSSGLRRSEMTYIDETRVIRYERLNETGTVMSHEIQYFIERSNPGLPDFGKRELGVIQALFALNNNETDFLFANPLDAVIDAHSDLFESLNNTDKMRKMGRYSNSKGLIMLDNIEEKLWNAHLIQSGQEGAIPHKMQEFLDSVSEHPIFTGIPIGRYREILRRYVSFDELDALRPETLLRTERISHTVADY